MLPSRQLPALDRISILAAAILLVFTLARFIDIPAWGVSVQLPGFFLDFQLNVQTIVALLVGGLTATGADWVIRGHPKFDEKFSIQHWLLPALTAWAIGTILFQQPFGTLWWIVFVVGSATLILVLISEYILVDPEDARQIPAMIWIIAISFTLFLILTITVRASETRLYLSVSAIAAAFMLASLRTSHLRLQRWIFGPILILTLVIGQISAALHYLPIRPITYGLLLLGPAYALTSFVGGLQGGRSLRQIGLEPILVLIIVWGIALIVG